jgi:phosphate starvation-inducible protein PhoH and related proteins
LSPRNRSEITLEFSDNRLLAALSGPHEKHFARMEQKLGVRIEMRGNLVSVSGGGTAAARERASAILSSLYARAEADESITLAEVDAELRFTDDERAAAPGAIKTAAARVTRPRSPAQAHYLELMRANPLVFGIGPAGTGKTWLAVAQAAQLFERKEVDRIILSRPAVEAGERLGFLPGDLREKVDPYLRPIYDALYDLMDSRIVERALQTGEIEIAPLAFMRGRTLTNAAIILDEAQNTTSMQMKMFLTRLGENSRMIITGDPSQVDLPNGQTSGLAEAAKLLDGVEGIAQVKFTAEDVIRHELVARIVAAYEGLPQRPATTKP